MFKEAMMSGNRLNRLRDASDYFSCKIGLRRPASWDLVRGGHRKKLYAGKLYRDLDQYRDGGFVGLTPFFPNSVNISHDMREAFPIPSESIDLFQSEDVFEHISLNDIPPIISEIYRVLRLGGLFRLSLPDYNCPILAQRSFRREDGSIYFDPDGGGTYKNGRVEGGGHLWFPTIATVKGLFAGSPFSQGAVKYLHYNTPDGGFIVDRIDHLLGYVQRVPEHDARTVESGRPISIVVDAYKTP